jgi:hypothetical protein
LAKLGIPRATFYHWYDRDSSGGLEALNDRSPRPDRVWNRIPDGVRDISEGDRLGWFYLSTVLDDPGKRTPNGLARTSAQMAERR